MSVVDEIKLKIDVVDFIGQYTELKKAGRNFKALCPFHNEKTPSFIVFPDQGTWHCFGSCATGGDVFTFLMKKENLDFGEALRRLAQRAGVELVRESPGESDERKRLREILATAAAHYHHLLKNNPAAQHARDYLAKRFIKPETIDAFQLGYALNEWQGLESFLTGKGFAVHDLEAAGLSIKGERGTTYDRFRGRLMFPIRNRNGEVTGFGARTLSGEEPKYLNSPQTALFDKSSTLYGLDLAKDAIRAQNLAVIVEGYMDVIGAHQGGFKNVVASLGTALTQKQLELLKRLTKRYALALDPDAAGEEATKRGLQVAREALDRKTVPVPLGAGLVGFEERLEAELLVISLPAGQDPDELIHDAPDRWQNLVEHAEPLVDFFLHALTRDLDLKLARDKSIAVKRLAPVVREVGDAVQRAHYTQQLARLVGVSEQVVAQEIGHTKRAARATPPPSETPVYAPAPVSKLEEYLLTLALRTPEHLSHIAFLDPEDFDDAAGRAMYLALIDFAVANDFFERESFRASLDESLQPYYDQLTQRGDPLPELNAADAARELERTAYRLRLQHDKTELAQLEVMLRDQDDEHTTEDEQLLRERVDFLRKRLTDGQKALSARTLLKPNPFYAAGMI
ncbi:MAG: DNA primase [Chloroflexi bacterium]|nr:DNA primase [Chloroflexota bacterium]